jgi:ribosomal protein S18 acetylase RimI-like enzyme
LKRADTMPQPTLVEPARPQELRDALRLIFHHLPEDERSTRVATALALIAQGELDPRGIIVVRDQTDLLGAMVVVLLPGATGLVWPPGAVTGPLRIAIEDQLTRHALAWLRQQGAKMGQAIIPPAEKPLVEALLRRGFKHMTTLWYFRHSLEGAQLEGFARLAQNLSFEAYSESLHDSFQQTLEKTYAGTMDCPELNGVRDLRDVIAGHRGQAHSSPRYWWLMACEGRPAGVLMLTPVPEWSALDISYLGVVPECRGRGLGRQLTAKALREARQEGMTQVTLAVDCRNAPAWNMYIDMGFEAQEPREVYLALWNVG